MSAILTKLVAWLKSIFASAEVQVKQEVTTIEAVAKQKIQAAEQTVVTTFEQKLQGWIPDAIDTRDQVFTLSAPLPPSVDLRSQLKPVDNQGALNSCVSHAVTSALETVLKVSDLSRLFTYYNARSLEGRTGMDAGCAIRNAVKGAVTYGIAPETDWPYVTTQVLVAPPTKSYTDGTPLKARIGYAQVTTLTALKTALATGLPVVFGFTVPDVFASAVQSVGTAYTGVLPYPTAANKFIGAHAVLAVGYDDPSGMVIVRNSFGPAWGKSGYFMMPYAWFANMTGLVSDAWVLSPKA
jgi:C1A family cysteine protease